jgi:hypothetical protein
MKTQSPSSYLPLYILIYKARVYFLRQHLKKTKGAPIIAKKEKYFRRTYIVRIVGGTVQGKALLWVL